MATVFLALFLFLYKPENARQVLRVLVIVGLIASTYFIQILIRSEVGDISRFPFGERLCSYARLVTTTYVSGEE